MSIFLLHPVMLSTAAIGAAILALHLFLPRWKRRRVASLMIWRRVAARGAGLSARRLSIDAVLLLAGLAAACLVIASADPRSVAQRTDERGLVAVIDNGTASASSGGAHATRLAEAAALAREDLRALGGSGDGALIVTSPSPAVLAPWGRASVAAGATGEVASVFVSGDLNEAVALALAAGPPSATVRVYTSRSIGEAPRSVERRSVGGQSRNVAFVRAEFSAGEVFCALRNYGASDVSTVVSLEVIEPSAAREVARREIRIAAGERRDLVLVPRVDFDADRADVVRLSHSYAEDDLAPDDEVWAARLPGAAARIGVMGSIGEPLSRALWAARAETFHLAPGSEVNAAEVDLCVYAGTAPSAWPPPVPSIIVAPPKDAGPVGLLGDELADVVASFEGSDEETSLVYGVSSRAILHVSGALRARIFGEHERIIVAGGETLVARLSESGRQHVYLGFRPEDSDWPVRASFPVFVARALAAAKSGAGQTRLGCARVGDVADDMLPPDVSSVMEAGGREIPRAAMLTAPGLYRVGRTGDRRLAVNLLDARESDTRIAQGATTQRMIEGTDLRARERFEAVGLAGVLCVLALALCAAEWCLSAAR